MREYPKIETLYERDETFSVTDVLKRPVLATINKWVVTEKVDGTNIRIDLRPDDSGRDVVTFSGRTDRTQFPAGLILYLEQTFTVEKMAALRLEPDGTPITLFGEGYGAGIQKGGKYRPDKAVILFDALIDDQWWMSDDVVTDFAMRLGVERVPILGEFSLDQIRSMVRAGIPSKVANGVNAEGIVGRTIEPLFDKMGRRLIIKLKTKDWKNKP